ncbi:MAG: acyloxyacyl hydrolase [Bacteroidia bacterium]|nr:acyloxyacyl hydrolase [Bacteroidia bacterium]
MYKLTLLFLTILSNYVISYAQESANCLQSINFEPKFYVGNILDHTSKLSHLIKGYCTSTELGFNKQSNSNKYWSVKRNYPHFGLSLIYTTMGNKEVLGNAISLVPNSYFSFFKPNSFLRFRLGVGLSYLTKRFHIVDNPTHTAIGSYLNAAAQLHLFTYFKLKGNTFLNTGIGLLHFSNGAYRLPNLGINIYGMNLGISFMKDRATEYLDSDTMKPAKANELVNFRTAISFKEFDAPGGPRYPMYELSVAYPFYKSEIKRAFIGVDGFYDKAIYYSLITTGSGIENKHKYSMRSGVWLGYELKMNKVSLIGNWGYYIFTPTAPRSMFYQRWGVQYNATDNISFGLTMKVHYFVVDVFAWGISYRL